MMAFDDLLESLEIAVVSAILAGEELIGANPKRKNVQRYVINKIKREPPSQFPDKWASDMAKVPAPYLKLERAIGQLHELADILRVWTNDLSRKAS
jgi:hypothetical protein